jgi:hypothetical protein
MTEETKIALTEFLDYLVREGYCDTDVYHEPPSEGITVIDQFMIIKRKE